MRNILFIGHATPEDNEFTIWLHSKLELEGYKVWCDLENLLGGERDFWTEIQRVIEHEACKYLLVFSKHTFQKDGVVDEFEFSRSIAKKYKFDDFVIPLKIDDVSYVDRIGINRYNVIDFSSSWIPGLRRLFKKLKNDEIPNEGKQGVGISEKILDLYHNDSKYLNQDQEKYYSNWWRIPHLPEKIFIFQYRDENAARMIIEEDAEYPVILHGNCLVSFEQHIKSICEKQGCIKIRFEDIHVIKVENILNGYKSNKFPTTSDSKNFLKRLLKKAFKNLMYENGLLKFDLSNTQCFYHKVLFDERKPIKDWHKINYHDGEKSKVLCGKYYGGYWHFGLSAVVHLDPFPHYSLKSHILFSDNGFKIWEKDSRRHSARRRKGKGWFNAEWRDLLMAFLKSLADENGRIFVGMSEDYMTDMPLLTEQFYSDVGYYQPESENRLAILHEDINELDEIDAEDEVEFQDDDE